MYIYVNFFALFLYIIYIVKMYVNKKDFKNKKIYIQNIIQNEKLSFILSLLKWRKYFLILTSGFESLIRLT